MTCTCDTDLVLLVVEIAVQVGWQGSGKISGDRLRYALSWSHYGVTPQTLRHDGGLPGFGRFWRMHDLVSTTSKKNWAVCSPDCLFERGYIDFGPLARDGISGYWDAVD